MVSTFSVTRADRRVPRRAPGQAVSGKKDDCGRYNGELAGQEEDGYGAGGVVRVPLILAPPAELVVDEDVLVGC